uniref:Phosphoglycerate mutase n=2 Tax=Anser TaxID=8842 RepID=A0A8B9I7V7_9AVES
MAKYKLVLLRHGEGAWNKENRFCSWVDQKLSSDGIREAQNCGKHLKALGFEFDLVFTSVLRRSIQTAWLILEEMGQEWVPIQSSWRLNERHYGALIGLNRAEMALNHGEEQVKIWRRSYDVTPPPITESHPYYEEIYNDRRYKCGDVSQDNLPKAESLKDVLDRLLPYWNEKIVPELKSGKMILISAHGNSSRALLKHVEAGRLRPQVLLKAEMEGEILIFFNSGQKKVDVIRSNVSSHFSLMQTFKLFKILLEAWSQNSLGCFRLVLDVNIIRGFIEIGAPENAWSFLHRHFR